MGRYTNQVSIGDEVLVERNGDLIPTKVIDISRFQTQGKVLTVLKIFN